MAKIKDILNFLKKKPYFDVRDAAWQFLIDNNVTSYPLNLKAIAENNNWEIWSYKKFCDFKKIDEDTLSSRHPDGFTIKLDENTQLICYNQNNNRWRNRFTIAHEMGHIILHENFEGKRLEQEANMFAARILMPMILIKELNIQSPEVLSKICDVSIEAATYRLERYNLIQERNKFYTSQLENKVYKQLKPFIKLSKTKP